MEDLRIDMKVLEDLKGIMKDLMETEDRVTFAMVKAVIIISGMRLAV